MFGEVRTMTNVQGKTFFVSKDVAKPPGYKKLSDVLSKRFDGDDSAKCGLIDSKAKSNR